LTKCDFDAIIELGSEVDNKIGYGHIVIIVITSHAPNATALSRT